MNEGQEYIKTHCIHCNKTIQEKPWISVMYLDRVANACGYSCGKHLSDYVGIGYFDRIVNKEDFNEPRPAMKVGTTIEITSTSYFDRGCRDIIDEEQKDLDKILDEYSARYEESSSSDGEYSD
tara:strand:+ start:625 stop:993 length:369 start_codon:yes stop_codon:yes gene_type:complete